MCYSALVRKDLDFLSEKFGASIVRESFDEYLKAVAFDSKKYPPIENERIFPGHFAPIIYERKGKRYIEPMRYSAFPPSFIPDPQRYTTFNARRDNLTSKFWSEMYGKNHGVVVLRGFFEWVKVSTLLKAGVVDIKDVEAEFLRQAELRKEKILASGKKYKPTPTELKDPRFRDVVIKFSPSLHQELIVPVIFSEGDDGKGLRKGFALITDDPPKEVRSAGHDRCPVNLDDNGVDGWLRFPISHGDINLVLDSKVSENFSHQLPRVS